MPFTTGILIGIGETRRERIESLLAIRDLGDRHGHIQEVIVQNFRAKPGTPMAASPEPSLEDHLWTIAAARLLLGPETSVQAPPNLRPGALARLVEAGIDDWGGVSPVTPDHVNPEAPWPHLLELEQATESAGKSLAPRLPLYPRYVADPERWVDPGLRSAVLAASDGQGLGRDSGWYAGDAAQGPGGLGANGDRQRAEGRGASLFHASNGQGSGHQPDRPMGNGEGSQPAAGFAASAIPRRATPSLAGILGRVREGAPLDEAGVVRLFEARGGEARTVCDAADALRHERNGDTVSYVVNRNVNYTNVCYFKCRFCAFSKGRLSANLRGRPYDLDLAEIGAPHPRGMGAGRHRGLSPGRHPPRLHRRDLSLDLPRGEGGGAGGSTCTPSRRWRSGRVPGRWASISASFWGGCARRGSAPCPAPRPRSSTTRCAG